MANLMAAPAWDPRDLAREPTSDAMAAVAGPWDLPGFANRCVTWR